MEFKIPEENLKEINKIKEDTLKLIYKDEEFSSFVNENNIPLEVVSKNISKFLRVLSDRKLCLNCPGINACSKKMGHLVLSLTYDDVYERIDNTCKVCPKAEVREDLKKRFIQADFNEIMLDLDFKEAKLFSPEARLKLLLYIAKEYLPSIEKEKYTKGIYLYGSSKVGKTHLMVLLAKEIIKRSEKSIAFVDSVNFFEKLSKTSYDNREDFNKMLDKFKNVDYLFFDDFGNEYKSDYIRDSIVFPLITYRASLNLPTFFTSSYSLDEIKTMYVLKKGGEIKASRLVDAINKLCESFSLNGIPYPH